MPLRTAEQYIASLRDGRTVYFRGQRVADVTTHPVIGVAVGHAAIDYAWPRIRSHAGAGRRVGDGDGEVLALLPDSAHADDLLKRSALIEQATAAGGTLVVLIKEIGTDALFGADACRVRASTRSTARGYARARRGVLSALPVERSGGRRRADRRQGRSLAGAVRAGRSRPLRPHRRAAQRRHRRPRRQGAYLGQHQRQRADRAADARDGARRIATTRSASPCRSHTPGLMLLASAYDSTGAAGLAGRTSDQRPPQDDGDDDGLRRRVRAVGARVPGRRVRVRRPAGAGVRRAPSVHGRSRTSCRWSMRWSARRMLMADLNGIAKAGHVREKLVQLISYAETLRGLTHYAALRASAREAGIVVPDPLYVNMAKYHFAHGYHEAVRHVQDIAGGALVTGPGAEDLASPETAPLLREVLRRPRRRERQGSAEGAEPREGSRGVGVRGVPGGAGGPRRGIARGREADGAPQLRSKPALEFVRRMIERCRCRSCRAIRRSSGSSHDLSGAGLRGCLDRFENPDGIPFTTHNRAAPRRYRRILRRESGACLQPMRTRAVETRMEPTWFWLVPSR